MIYIHNFWPFCAPTGALALMEAACVTVYVNLLLQSEQKCSHEHAEIVTGHQKQMYDV